MKKVVTLLAVAVASMALVAGTASASTGGVVIDRGFACGVLDGYGNIIVTYNSTMTVYSNQQSGTKVVMRCEGWGAGAKSLTYFNYSNTGLLCGVGGYATADWSNKVGRNGNSQLTCTLYLGGNEPVSAGGGSAGLG